MGFNRAVLRVETRYLGKSFTFAAPVACPLPAAGGSRPRRRPAYYPLVVLFVLSVRPVMVRIRRQEVWRWPGKRPGAAGTAKRHLLPCPPQKAWRPSLYPVMTTT